MYRHLLQSHTSLLKVIFKLLLLIYFSSTLALHHFSFESPTHTQHRIVCTALFIAFSEEGVDSGSTSQCMLNTGTWFHTSANVLKNYAEQNYGFSLKVEPFTHQSNQKFWST
eukprot:TRINITY_DN7956_c0_g2_i1.p1 TRINITY_DN7956_c0_g2~~TRINITY_DN7956_c0_g2_i1.p1  ORF type:complete len:112 (-),score=15.03 TRINITY_DN7956_c0_g2_i1:381-716(-)